MKQRGRGPLDADLLPLWGDQGPGAVAVILHHAKDGNGQAILGQHPAGHRGVGGPAVDEQQVRPVGKVPVPLDLMAKAAGDHLLHWSIVIRAGEVPELEVAVTAPFLGFPSSNTVMAATEYPRPQR